MMLRHTYKRFIGLANQHFHLLTLLHASPVFQYVVLLKRKLRVWNLANYQESGAVQQKGMKKIIGSTACIVINAAAHRLAVLRRLFYLFP